MPAPTPGLHIDRFTRGLVTNRAATATPFRYVTVGSPVVYRDTLIDGSNVEISPKNTLVRRPGWSKYCSATYNTETPKGFASAIINGTLYDFFDTDQNVYLFDTGSLTSIYSKATTAQTHYQQVGDILYFSDGNANKKFTVGTGTDTHITNAGVAAPPNAPTIPNLNLYDTVGASQTVHAWVPNAVYANTTASAQNYFFLAPTGEVQWAVVPAGTTLQSQSSAPNWSAQFGVFGGITTDGTMPWTNCGSLLAWAPATAFKNSTFLAVSQMSAASTSNTKATSGSTSVNWSIGSASVGISPSTGTTGNSNTFKITGLGFAVPSGATINGVQVSALRGTNRANAVSDVTVKLLKAGTASGNNKAAVGFWPQTLYNVYTVPTTGQGVAQNYGSNTDLWGNTLGPSDVNDTNFGVEFVCNQGSTRTTTAAIVFPITVTVYYTISSSDISGSVYAQVLVDSNGNLQRVKTGGTSGSSAPSWSKTIGGTTTDNTVTWECLGTSNQIPCLFSRSYASSFHTSSPHTSTLSPTLVVQAPIIGQNVNVQGFGSGDAQVDRNDLYRTSDGGSLLLYDASAPNVDASTTWTINDTALDSDLNFEIIGPVADANDPPPVGLTILAYHMGRLWGVVGNSVVFSAGPDCINGDGNQAWPPANEFEFEGPVNALSPTSAGLVVETADQRSIILGGPQTNTFWVQPLLTERGVQSPNCSVQDGDEIVSFTSAAQLFDVSSTGENEIGEDIAANLAATFNPATSYLAIHRSGQDQGIFISDGSTKIQRYNMKSGGWDPLATPANGIGPIASIDTAIGTKTLLSAAGGFILARDPSTTSDAGTAFSAFATVGSIVLSEPGEKPPYRIKSMLLTSAAVGSALGLSVLPNEISGSFTSIPLSKSDPWELPASTTINMKSYDWLGVQTVLANCIRHLQIKITFPTEAAANEVFSLSITPND